MIDIDLLESVVKRLGIYTGMENLCVDTAEGLNEDEAIVVIEAAKIYLESQSKPSDGVERVPMALADFNSLVGGEILPDDIPVDSIETIRDALQSTAIMGKREIEYLEMMSNQAKAIYKYQAQVEGLTKILREANQWIMPRKKTGIDEIDDIIYHDFCNRYEQALASLGE